MSKSLLMKLFTVTIIPLIIAPVLTYAAPNPGTASKPLLIPTVTIGGTSAATPVHDYTRDPGYAANFNAMEETMHLYSLALDSKNLTQLDVLFAPGALVSVDSFKTTLTLSAAKIAINSAPNKWLLSTKHTFVIDKVLNYNPDWFFTSGHWSLMKSFITPDNHIYNTTFYSNFTDTFDLLPISSSEDKRWQFTTRTFNNGYF